jgi:riboflavin synthase
MFTGIITDVGTVLNAEQRGDLRLVIGTGYDMDAVALGASIACSGVCLTVVEKGNGWFAVDVLAESVARTASTTAMSWAGILSPDMSMASVRSRRSNMSATA